MNIRQTLKIDKNGHLEIGGLDTVKIAQQFGTPVYVYDEAHIRNMMRAFKKAVEDNYDGNGLILYASKAFSCTAIYRIAMQEGIGVDVVSGGELFTALKADFPADKMFLHGNNKLYSEIEFAIDRGIGYIVVDSYSEADVIEKICEERGITQNILIRINPGVEAHTHEFIQTARTDSKFGFSISDGSAEKIIEYILGKKHIVLKGFHCHIGSQIFENQSFILAARKVVDFVKKIKNAINFDTDIINLGGGFGIWYNDEDPKLQPCDYYDAVSKLLLAFKEQVVESGIKMPFIVLEPGRSIVGEAGITLYTVGAIKEIKGVRKYVAVDGGMFENPRYALYQAKYTAVLANRATEPNTEKVSIAGKCCESGDLIAVDVPLPKVASGDILAVLSTGAYNYSMASNYNRNFVPPVIIVADGKADYIVNRQSYEDLVRNDVMPERLK